MRSYEDRWNWLRAQLEDDKAALESLVEKARAEGALERAGVYLNRGAYNSRALALMDDADRNGPVEPL